MKSILVALLAVQLAAADWPVPVNVPVHPLAGCDYTLTDEIGTITSPLFPSNYANNLNCSWLIFVGPGKQVQLSFESFVVELGKDFVLAYDGPTASYPMLLNATGYIIPSMVHSSANAMLLRFTTNPTIQYAGFRVHYEAVIVTPPPTPPLPLCGGDIFGSGTFSPPAIPAGETDAGNYLNNLNCTWYLQSSNPGQITISIAKFKSENKVDYLKIWDGWTTDGEPKEYLTGDAVTDPTVYTSTVTNHLTVLFYSDGSVGFPVFTATFN